MNRKTVLGIMLMLFLTCMHATTKTIVNVSAVPAHGVGVYWDSDCSNTVSSIDWGTLNPGSMKNIVAYIRNEGEEPVFLILSTTNWNPPGASEFLNLGWDYEDQWINPGEVIQITLTLSVSSYIEGISSVTFDAIIAGVHESIKAVVSIAMSAFIISPTWTLKVNPNVLNLKSKGKWITCYVELPKGYDVSDIDRATILLNDTIPVDPFWIDKPLESVIGDTISDFIVKFDRQALIEYLKTKGITGVEVTLTITGEANGISFEATDTIKVVGR